MVDLQRLASLLSYNFLANVLFDEDIQQYYHVSLQLAIGAQDVTHVLGSSSKRTREHLSFYESCSRDSPPSRFRLWNDLLDQRFCDGSVAPSIVDFSSNLQVRMAITN